MAEEIRLDVVAVAHSKGLTDTAREVKVLKGEADKLTSGLGRLEDGTFNLDAALEQTRLEVKRLQQEFAATGNKGLFGDIRDQGSLLKRLEGIAKEIADADGSSVGVTIGSAIGTKSGQGVFSGITDAIQSIPGTARGVLIGSAIGIGAVMSPAIGAVIAGAVVGVAGTGGLVGGILAASGDTRVARAWQKFGEQLSPTQFGREAFVGPLIAATEELGQALEDMNLGEAFAEVAPFLENLAEGVGDFGRNIMPGFTHALQKSGPVINELAEGFADTGTAVGDMLRDMSDSEGTVEGMRYTFMLLNGAIHVVGDTVAGLGTAFHHVAAAGAEVTGVTEDIARWVPLMGPFAGLIADTNNDLEALSSNFEGVAGGADVAFEAVNALSRVINPFAGYVLDAANNVDALNTKLSDLFSDQMDVDRAAIAWDQAIDDLTDSVKDNGRSLDITTQKGRDNKDMLLDGVDAAIRARDATKEQTKSTEIADGAYRELIKRLKEHAVQLGLNKDEIDRIVGNYEINIAMNIKWKQFNKPSISTAILSESFAASEVFKGFHDGGFVPGQKGAPQLAVVHGGEYVVSNQMQAQGSMGSTTIRVIVQDTSGRILKNELINDAIGRGVPEATVRAAYP